MKGSPEKTKKEAERRASFELLCRFCPGKIEKIRLPVEEACNKQTNQKTAPINAAGT